MEERGCVFLKKLPGTLGTPILGLAFTVGTELKSPGSVGLCLCQGLRAKELQWIKA